jgi:universal stress protein E
VSFSNILVGVDLQSGDRLAADDLSEATRVAIARAIWLAEHTRARLTFYAVLDLSAEGLEELQLEEEQDADTVQDAGHAVLDELVATARHAGLEADRALGYGRPWEQICKQVQRGGYDLVVCGTKNRSAASRFLFGGTSMKLMRCCPCPVWVTKPDRIEGDPVVLVASDLGPTGEKALRLAVLGAQLAQAKLLVLHSVERGKDHAMWLKGIPSDDRKQELERKRAEAQRTLQEQLQQTDHRTLPFGVQVLVETGVTEYRVVEAIEEHEVDLLVIGTSGRRGLAGWLMGNTCEQLLPQVECSILAVKPDGFECPVEP